MPYEYGLPFPVTLKNGEYFPEAAGSRLIHEILSIHPNHESGHAPIYFVTQGIDEEGEPTEIAHHTRAGLAGVRWYVTGRCRIKLAGTDEHSAVIWLRRVDAGQAEESTEAEAAKAPNPPTRRRNAGDSQAQAASDTPGGPESAQGAAEAPDA